MRAFDELRFANMARYLRSLTIPLFLLILSAHSDSAQETEASLSYEDLATVWPENHGEATLCLWPGGREAALSITIDDNNAPDIPFWQEMAEATGWKFTWFLIVHPMMWDIEKNEPGNNTSYFGTPEDYRPLLEAGHEIELHGSCKAMNHLSAEAYEEHLLKSKTYLEEQLGHTITTYAYPCGKIGTEDDPTRFHSIIQRHFTAARGTQGGPTPIHLIDFHNTKSMGPFGMRKPEADQRWLDRLANPDRPPKYSSYRGWGVILYHGLGDEAKKAKLRQALLSLKDEEEEGKYWVAPFSIVARYLKTRAAATVTVTERSPDAITFTVDSTFSDPRAAHPLTVKVRVNGWNSARAMAGDTPLPTRTVTHGPATYALVDATPGKQVTLKK